MEQIPQDGLCYQIAHQIETCSGQKQGITSSYKFINKLWDFIINMRIINVIETIMI